MESDYISRKEMHKANCDEWQGVYGFVDYNIFEDNENMIDRVPAADVRPVVRAHWEIYQAIGSFCLNGDFYVSSWQCSECKGISTLYSHYCPNCGACMIEDKGDYKDV